MSAEVVQTTSSIDPLEIAGLVAAVSAVVVSVVSLALARRSRIHDRIWSILVDSPANLRSLEALDDDEDQTVRLKMLGRTASSLDMAGASELGDALRRVCRHAWGPAAEPEAETDRVEFQQAVARFMNRRL